LKKETVKEETTGTKTMNKIAETIEEENNS